MKRAGIEPKQLAEAMQISVSLLQRGFKNTEHLSWHRLLMGPDAFLLELLMLLAEKRGIATVRRQILVERVG